MKILIFVFGTRGDVQPYVALAKGLIAAGEDTTICTAEGYRDLIDAHRVPYAYMSDDMLQLIQHAMPAMHGPRDAVRLVSHMTAAMRASLLDQWAAAQEVRPDVVVYHPKCLGGYHIAEKLGVPGVASLPLPFFTPTSDFPIPFIGHWPLGGRANRASYHFQRFTALAYGRMINDFHRELLQLRPIGRLDDMLTQHDGTPVHILYPFSHHVRPVPADYPPHAHVTGYWFLDRDPAWTPSRELEAFLDAGDPPVYVGFGSMGFGRGGDRRQDSVIAALREVGARGIVSTGWGGMPDAKASSSVLTIADVPHDWLFPRIATAVHHGGSGTTGASLRAGRPTVVCPFLGDQPFWGHQVHQIGAGPTPLRQRRLTGAALAERLDTAAGAACQAAARDVGHRISAETGVVNAVRILRDIAGG